MSDMSEKEDAKEERKKKAAIVRKAAMLSVLIFFGGIGLFIVLVLAVVKFATKTPGGGA